MYERDQDNLSQEPVRRQLDRKPPKEENALWEWIKAIFFAVAIALIIKTFLFQPTRVQGSSMIHTLENDDRIVVNKIGMKISPLERGDIIVMEFDSDHDYVKRIVGLPGEYVQIIDGKVYINGNLHEEDYIYGDYTDTYNGFEWHLGEDEYFVMGDNRSPNGSTDSRVFGPVNIDRIRGTAEFRYFPFDHFGIIR